MLDSLLMEHKWTISGYTVHVSTLEVWDQVVKQNMVPYVKGSNHSGLHVGNHCGGMLDMAIKWFKQLVNQLFVTPCRATCFAQ